MADDNYESRDLVDVTSWNISTEVVMPRFWFPSENNFSQCERAPGGGILAELCRHKFMSNHCSGIAM